MPRDLPLEPGEDHRPEEFALTAHLPNAVPNERATVVEGIIRRRVFRKRRLHLIPGVERERLQDLFARAPEVVERIDAERCLFGEFAHRERAEPATAEEDPRCRENLLATQLDVALAHQPTPLPKSTETAVVEPKDKVKEKKSSRVRAH